jgi:hypothetical protein
MECLTRMRQPCTPNPTSGTGQPRGPSAETRPSSRLRPANLLGQSLRVGPPKSVTLMLFDLDTRDLRQIRPNHEREFLT